MFKKNSILIKKFDFLEKIFLKKFFSENLKIKIMSTHTHFVCVWEKNFQKKI